MEQSPCLHVSPPTEKITNGGNNERKLYERKASISTAGFDGASMVISMLVNSLYNIVDSFFVAQISEDAMTALSWFIRYRIL